MTSPRLILLGAVAGDMIGAPYEYIRWKKYAFPLFNAQSRPTDDTYLTLAVAQAILDGGEYAHYLHRFGNEYPSDYGTRFGEWLAGDDLRPYGSWGNGSAMRVSAVGWAFDTREAVLREAAACAGATHNHPEAVQGAQAVALAVFLARNGASRDQIRNCIESRFCYDLSYKIDEIRPNYEYSERCLVTVPAALIAFLDSNGFEDALRKAISLGGDADTLAAITGAIAEAFYDRVPEPIASEVRRRLPPELWQIIESFSRKYALS